MTGHAVRACEHLDSTATTIGWTTPCFEAPTFFQTDCSKTSSLLHPRKRKPTRAGSVARMSAA